MILEIDCLILHKTYSNNNCDILSYTHPKYDIDSKLNSQFYQNILKEYRLEFLFQPNIDLFNQFDRNFANPYHLLNATSSTVMKCSDCCLEVELMFSFIVGLNALEKGTRGLSLLIPSKGNDLLKRPFHRALPQQYFKISLVSLLGRTPYINVFTENSLSLENRLDGLLMLEIKDKATTYKIFNDLDKISFIFNTNTNFSTVSAIIRNTEIFCQRHLLNGFESSPYCCCLIPSHRPIILATARLEWQAAAAVWPV